MRTYKKKTERGNSSLAEITEAVERVKSGESIRSVSKDYSFSYATLSRYVKKSKEGSLIKVGYQPSRQIFTPTQTAELVNYLRHASQIYFGLSPTETRKLAFECAVAFGVDVPSSWHINKMAGPEWLTIFLKKNPQLSIRTPEATSLARATSFNKTNVAIFFQKLAEVRDRYNFTATNIWNVDETGVTTVQKLNKVVAEKGVKQVGGLTSSERGVLVTVCCAVSASGNFIPPMFIFPRKRYQPHFIRDGPIGSIGRGNASGWMTATDFYTWMEHFISHVRPSITSPVLLTLDNHESHLAIKTINLAKANGVVLLSFPPHCSHRLQPLDRSVYGPFKKFMSVAQDALLSNNPGKGMTIYDIPGLVAQALPRALLPESIAKGFRVSGIEPFDINIFGDSDFLPSTITDRPYNECASTQVHVTETNVTIGQTSGTIPSDDVTCYEIPKAVNTIIEEIDIQSLPIIYATENEFLQITNGNHIVMSLNQLNETISLDINQPGPSNIKSTSSNSPIANKTNIIFKPSFVRPFPKAAPRKENRCGRKKRKSAILTDTPEKNMLEKEEEARLLKVNPKPAKHRLESRKIKRNVKRKVLQERDDWFCLVCGEAYSRSKPGESWVMCVSCKFWAHEACTGLEETNSIYSCHECAK